jgi:hypothetical protein
MSKFALIVGNSEYGGGNDVSGAEDASAMGECLKRLGFEVIGPVLNGNLDITNEALEEFGKKIHDPSVEVAVFFYSGHGFQVDGKNFLLPPGGEVSVEASLLLDRVIQKLGFAPSAAFKFAFLDACRDKTLLPEGATAGMADAPSAPARVLQAFAASPGQLAASGSKGTRSPYTNALLRYLPLAGLALPDLLQKVGVDTFRDSPQGQQPIVAGAVPADFFFRKPVAIPTDFPEGKSELLVFLRGELILDTSQLATDAASQPVKPTLRLNAGDNELVLMVANGKSHHNNHDWDVTEGWSYQLDLTLPDGTLPEGKVQPFFGNEDIPFKDGPHYGKVFRVAQVNLQVDPQTGVLNLLELKKDLANKEAPFFGSDQQTLVQMSIAELNLSPDDILGDSLGAVSGFLKPFLVQFLKNGTVLGTTIADPSKTFVTVLGNAALKDLATACMADRPARIADLKASIAAVFSRKPTPFETFDQGLMACMRARAKSLGSPLQPDDIRIWTALQDLSNQPAAIVPAAAPAPAPAPDLVPVG